MEDKQAIIKKDLKKYARKLYDKVILCNAFSKMF
jgi:hypothetical protein